MNALGLQHAEMPKVLFSVLQGGSVSGRERQREASNATRIAIAEAAAQEFLIHGYAGASLSRIGSRLGLTKGALVYHFHAKADFASYFLSVVKNATAQADAFARAEYPDCGPRRLLLQFLTMGTWRSNEPQVAAGIALFADRASPVREADDIIKEWLDLGIDAFKSRENQGTPDALEAAEMFLVTQLGLLFFGRHVRFNKPGTRPMRFVRLALTAVGVSDVDVHAEEVIATYTGRLPELNIDFPR